MITVRHHRALSFAAIIFRTNMARSTSQPNMPRTDAAARQPAGPVPSNTLSGRIGVDLGNVLSFVTVLVMTGSVAYSIAHAEWMPDLYVVLWSVFFGALAGLALAYSSFPRWTAHLASAIYGLFVIAVIGGTRPDIAILDEWRERVYLMLDKVVVWVREAFNNGSSRETLIFFLMLSGLFWLLSYSAAWYTFRTRRIWHVILPTGVTLFSNIYYYAGERSMAPFLAIYLVCVVILLALSHLADREESWIRNRIRFTTSLRLEFVLTGLAIALIALFFSWRVTAAMTSPIAREWFGQFNEPYNEFLARWNRMFSTLQNPVARPTDSYLNEFDLGGPRNLTEEPVMQVLAPPARYYWRAASYDNYDGRTWRSTLAIEQNLTPDDASLPLAQYQSRRLVRAEFDLKRGTDAVYVPSQPQRASIAARAVLDSSDPGAIEIAQMKLPAMLLPGNKFSGWGSVSAAKINELRVADTVYPGWVQKYLQVPSAVPPRVIDLAANVMRGQNTAFDKALATERWLRQNIKYDEKLEAPPQGIEGSEYVLFETRRAYCNYYATAMVTMLRSQGVPARMAVGYAQGDAQVEEVDSDVATYNVRQLDSHAWVEVYFPGFGWVEFEPTAAQPEIPRLEDAPADNATPTPSPATPTALPTLTPLPGEATPTPPPADAAIQQQQTPPLADFLRNVWDAIRNSALRYLLLIPILLGLAWLALRVAEQAGFSSLPMVERAYAMLTRWAGWLGIGTLREHTPFEQADELAARAPDAGENVRRITALYVARRFAPKRDGTGVADDAVSSLRDASEADALWRGVRNHLGRAWVLERVRAFVLRSRR
jgi:transglutaminase-like putative cysteine protease